MHANSFITPSMIAAEMAVQVRNNLVMGNLVHTDYKKEFHTVGDTVTIDKPSQYVVGSGATATAQDMVEQKTSISVDKQRHVLMQYGSGDLTLSMRKFTEKHVIPAAIQLANTIDVDLCGLYNQIPEFELATGTAGAEPASLADLGRCARALNDAAVPMQNRALVLNPGGYQGLSNVLGTLFNEPINKNILRENTLGRFMGFDTYMSQNIAVHSAGSAAAATAETVGASQGTVSIGTTGLVPDGTVAYGSATIGDTWNVGDVVTFASVYAVNPITRATLSRLKRFRVSTAATAGSNGTGNLIIAPGIITSGAYQNASGAPAATAAITIYPASGTRNYAQNLAFNKDAFALVTVDLKLPKGAGSATMAEYEGISIRMVEDYTILTDQNVVRFDILYGVAAINPHLAMRLSGS